MGVGEAGAITGDKPQAHADKAPFAGSTKHFNEAIGLSAGPASGAQAAVSGEEPMIVRIDGGHVGEVASMAQNPFQGLDFQGLDLSAALGKGGALLATDSEALALPTLLEGGTGESNSIWLGTFANFGLGASFGANPINRGKEGIDAGSNPVSVVGAAATDTFSGKVAEKITNKSILTDENLNLSTGERVTGGTFVLVEGSMSIMGVREFARAPGVGEPHAPRRTPAEPTGNETSASTQKQLSVGSTSADDVAAITGKGTAGGDAEDTLRMRKPGSLEESGPSDTTSVSGSWTDEITGDIPDAGNNVRTKKVGSLDVAKMLPSASSAGGAEAGAAVPTISVDQIVDAYVQGYLPAEIRNSVSEDDIAAMKERYKVELRRDEQPPEIADDVSDDQYRLMAMADDIDRHDNRTVAGNAQLKKYDGPTESPDGWHVRMNKSPPGTDVDTSWVKADQAHPVDRFDVNVKADHAPEFADYVSGELNKKGIKFQLKVASEIDGYARADSGLVYTQGKDFEAVSDVISKYRELHPDAVAEGSPAFAKPMGKGISVAEDPIQEGLPVVHHGAHSFNKAPAAASVEQIRVLARARLQSAGFDPERPWLAQGSKVDRFRDVNVARSNAANAGAASDDTMPVPAAEAGPPPLPRRQGDPEGNAA